ncbi:MAG: putative metal-binding motif-containing protein, partial [Myxococcota bacterium]|nr:putative metal-binding motif-containing protein [Myxococcota bacterium]
MAHLRPRTVAAFLALVPTRAAAHGNLLVYGAADDGTADALATAGHTVTVWDDGTWRAAAQADFETYDAIVIPSGGCGGAAPTAFDALHATRAVWGPATTGFVLVSGQLPECHLDTAAAGQLIDYAADWAAMGPGTGLVVWSDHGTRGLDFMTGVGAFSSAAGAADVFGSIDATHGAWGGLGRSQLEGWGDSAVSTITAWPSDFEVVLSDASGQTVAVARDSCDWDIDGFLAQGATCGGTDCDDRAFRVYPGAPEDCDGIDDDCNGIVDDSPSIGGTMFHADSDGDGFGDPAISVV